MATYRIHNHNTPSSSYKDYMPEYRKYDYTKPSETYSDSSSPYASDISAAQSRLAQLERSRPAGYSSTYTDQINTLINNMANREFNYDVNGDPLYQQYKHSYMTQGKQAMEDTIGQAAAMTGGYGNSYATAAGGQAYQSYLDRLNDRIPELYQIALDRYNTEGADMQTLYSMMSGQEAQDYGKYRDRVSDYQTDRAHYSDQVQNLRTMGQNLWGQGWDNYWNAADRTDTNYQNAVNTALNRLSQEWDNYHWANEQTQHNYEQAVAEDQWGANFAENQRQYNASQAQASTKSAAASANATTGLTQNYSKARNGILTRYEYERNGINRRYNSYEDYVKQKIDKNKDLTDMERLALYKDLLGVR